MNTRRFKGKLLDQLGGLISEVDGDLKIVSFECDHKFQGKPFNRGWFFVPVEHGDQIQATAKLVLKIDDGPTCSIRIVLVEPSDDPADTIVEFRSLASWHKPCISGNRRYPWPSSPHGYHVPAPASGVAL